MVESIREYISRSPLNGVLFMLLLVFAGASLFSFLGFVLCELFLGVPLLSNPSLMDECFNPDMISAFRVMQVLQAVGMLIVPAVVYLWISSTTSKMKRLFAIPKRQPLMLSVAFFMVGFPLINYIADLNASVEIPTALGEWMSLKEEKASALTSLFLDMPSIGLLLFNLVMIAILPALGEELIFRGVIQSGLRKLSGSPHLAIWITAILFSAVHLQFFGFVPRMLMGAAMGYLFYWSGNLWYPIAAHLTNNAMSVILAYGIQQGSINSDLEFAGIGNLNMAFFSAVFCLMLLYLFNQVEQAKTQA